MLVPLFLLMGADTLVQLAPKVAVMAEDAIAGRVALILEPYPVATATFLTPFLTTTSGNVVERKEQALRLTTARTAWTLAPISPKNVIADDAALFLPASAHPFRRAWRGTVQFRPVDRVKVGGKYVGSLADCQR